MVDGDHKPILDSEFIPEDLFLVLSKFIDPSCISMAQPPVTTPGLLASAAQAEAPTKVNNSLRVYQQTVRKTGHVEIKRIVRPVRGGSQARIIEGQDGRFYVAKFAGNPQGNRTLVNEWIAQSIMSYLSISTPALRILRLPDNLRTEDLSFAIGHRNVPVDGEWHLGSLCPVNPQMKTIFDFLPRRLLEKVSNLNDFAKVFVVDRWLYQLDQRQAVFVRERNSEPGQISLRAHFIDHGMAFAGSAWELREATGHGLYMDRGVYSLVNMPQICEETVSQIERLSKKQLLSVLATIPEAWLSSDDREELNRLLESLYKNTSRLRRIVGSQLASLSLNTGAGLEKKRMGCVRRPATATSAAYGA